jgi:hypothetical protein
MDQLANPGGDRVVGDEAEDKPPRRASRVIYSSPFEPPIYAEPDRDEYEYED